MHDRGRVLVLRLLLRRNDGDVGGASKSPGHVELRAGVFEPISGLEVLDAGREGSEGPCGGLDVWDGVGAADGPPDGFDDGGRAVLGATDGPCGGLDDWDAVPGILEEPSNWF